MSILFSMKKKYLWNLLSFKSGVSILLCTWFSRAKLVLIGFCYLLLEKYLFFNQLKSTVRSWQQIFADLMTMFFNDVFVRLSIPFFVQWLWKFNTNKGLFSCLVDRPSSFLCTSQLFMENLTSKHNICAKLIAEHNVTFLQK